MDAHVGATIFAYSILDSINPGLVVEDDKTAELKPGLAERWEVLEPTDENSFLHRFLKERGPGLHHVTFEVESIDNAIAALKEKGIEPFGGRSYDKYKELFIHPKDSGGVLFQLYEGAWD